MKMKCYRIDFEPDYPHKKRGAVLSMLREFGYIPTTKFKKTLHPNKSIPTQPLFPTIDFISVTHEYGRPLTAEDLPEECIITEIQVLDML